MDIDIAYVTKASSLELLKKELSMARIVGIDTETYGFGPKRGLDPISGTIRLVQVAVGKAVYVIDMHHVPTAPVAELIGTVLYDRHLVKVLHNAKFDLKFFSTNFNVDLREVSSVFCTHVAWKILQGGQMSPANLAAVCQATIGIELDKAEQKFDYSQNVYKEQITYAGIDAAVLVPIYRQLADAIVSNNLQKVAKLEMECVPAVCALELNGFYLDRGKWSELAKSDKDRLAEAEHELRTEYGFGDVNLESNQQMWKLLSSLTGVPVRSRSKETIEDLINGYTEKPDMFGNVNDYRPALIKYLEYTDLAKDVSTYGFSFLDNIHKDTGRIHSSFQQNDTKTQRFSSSGPNLQNIPRDSDRRAAFVAAPGKALIRYDYSAFELRILAQFSKDELFCKAFREQIDAHRLSAAAQYNVSFDQVTDKMRQDIKPINFGIPYGLGAPGLAAKLNVSVKEAQARLNKYFKDHPRIRRWHNEQFEYYKKYDCVRTPSGRLRALPTWKFNSREQHIADQAAKNFPIQSTNADALKLWLTRVFHEIPDAACVNTVHDEGMWEVPIELANDISPEIKRLGIEAAQEFVPDIPIEMEGGVAECWKK